MPRRNGRQLAVRLKSIRADMEVLIMAGHTDDAVLRNGVYESAMNYLQKPFTPASLTQKVREVLQR